ncbi:cold shock domain-containing protein [Citricoccus nitrophenolicus]|uniref:cold shock domain-containing protein n=1 Tax=Citricoccus nitrophenolicus TaxID=863575 RepID=UPI0039B4D691
MDELPMTRARLYVLISSFENDIRENLRKYVIDDLGEEVALGSFYSSCVSKADSDRAGTQNLLSNFLDLREAYDLMNTHRGRLPSDLATETRELTTNLDRLVAIRNRVMHSRPLAQGDGDAALSLLNQFRTGYWNELRRTMAQLHADPEWEPAILTPADQSKTLHNLPLADYDDTGLIGRSKEVSEIVALLKRGREPVITITGEGGIGKTALALEVAYRLVDDQELPFEAVLWTSLKYEKLTAFGVKQISGAARDIVGAVQPAGSLLEAGFSGSIEDLAELLSGFKVLLVLDNLETISGDEFRSLYDALPDDVTYLITSRIGVGEYERRYSLEALSDIDSLQLFNQFVRSRRISGLDRLNKEVRIKVVQALRHSPLAIKWFALAVEAGNDPVSLIRRQDDLLEFCVRSVYDDLSRPAREVLVALDVLARPLTSDELVVLLDRPVDEVSLGVQELIRGSLVRRQSASSEDEFLFQIVLTETATQFLGRRIKPDQKLQRQLEVRDREFREVQEKRASDMAVRSLAPVVVRQRSEADAPTCTLLRQALLLTRKGEDRETIYERIDLARRMNPDFWEVDRVEGFIRDSFGELAAATASYERAYATAKGEDRAVVAHFFAGHLARKVRDVNRAVEYAREAHDELDSAETSAALGSYLIWSHKFDEGTSLLESAIPRSTGRSRVIAVSALAEGWRRYAESVGGEDHNPLRQFQLASKGFGIGMAAIESGIVDERLRATATDCAVVAVKGAVQSGRAGIRVPGLVDHLTRLDTTSVRLVGSRSWPSLVQTVRQLAVTRGAPIAAKRLLERIDELTGEGVDSSPPVSSSETLVGEIVNVSERFGFIRHPKFPENVFFHAGSVISQDGIRSLKGGNLVRFSVEIVDRGPRAKNVHLAEYS